MYNVFKIVFYPLSFVEIILLKFYKSIISPIIKPNCCFIPSCSVYMLKSIEHFGPFIGVFIGGKRLFKCNGKHKGGVDLEPLNLKGDFKWVC